MKKIILPVMAMLLCMALSAQFKLIGETAVFKENEEGQGRLLLMKNRSTVFFQTTGKKVEIRIYDAQFKEKIAREIEPAFFQKKHWEIESIFEINGNIVVMVNQPEDKTPQLVRVIIDGTKGNIIEEKIIASIQRKSNKEGYSKGYGGLPIPDFFVRKDPNSDNYAVAMLSSMESDGDKRIEIFWYGENNHEISHAYYASPHSKYKYMEYVDMAIIGKEMVSVLVKAYNTKSSGGEETELLLGKLSFGSKEITASGLEFSKNMVIKGGIIRYNKVTKRIILLGVVREPGKNDGYIPYLAYVNPVDHKVEFTSVAYPGQANEKSLELFGRKRPYTGMPQNIYINDDGSFSIVYEEAFSAATSGGNSELGNIAIANYSIIGTETGSYFIPKYFMLRGTTIPGFYKSGEEGKTSSFHFGNQYKKFAYLDGAKKTYLLFNDVEKNGESAKRGRTTIIHNVGECDGFYFDISGDEVMPDRKYFFGKPKGKNEHQLGIFGISEYSRALDIFVTLKLEKDGGDKGVKLVWMRPE